MNISRIGSTNFSYNTKINLSKSNVNNTENTEKTFVKKNNNPLSLGESPKKDNALESLMKQKENLTNVKSSIMEKGTKNLDDPVSLQKKIQEIDKQIQEIDKQINTLQIETQQKAIGSGTETKNKKNSDEKENNYSNKDINKDNSMSCILDLSSGLKTAKDLSHNRNMMVNYSKVLEGEIRSDERRGINPIRKKENLNEINNKIENLSEALGTHLNNLNDKIKNNTQKETLEKVTTENKENENDINNTNLQLNNNLLIEKQQNTHKIGHYVNSMLNNENTTDESFNIIA